MNDQNHEEKYYEYISKFNYDELIDIRNHLDRGKFPGKFKVVCEKIQEFESNKEFIKTEGLKEKKFNSKAATIARSIGALSAIILFEYILKLSLPDSATLRQIGRIFFILAVTFYIANRTRKDFDASLKTLYTLCFTGIGIS